MQYACRMRAICQQDARNMLTRRRPALDPHRAVTCRPDRLTAEEGELQSAIAGPNRSTTTQHQRTPQRHQHRDTETQRRKHTTERRHRDTETPRHRDTGAHRRQITKPDRQQGQTTKTDSNDKPTQRHNKQHPTNKLHMSQRHKSSISTKRLWRKPNRRNR